MKDPIEINGETRIVGIIGYPVAHSLSPRMHNAAFVHYQMNWCYLPFPVAPSMVADALRGLRAIGVMGVNVTVPHKAAVLSFLDGVDEEARTIGAVNTIHVSEGKLVGYNTDAYGLIEALRREGRFDPSGRRVGILGAGGAARAACVALAREGAKEVILLNRTPERARRLAKDLGGAYARTAFSAFLLDEGAAREVLPSCDLVIQTTTVGMGSEETPVQDATIFHEGMVVMDLVYHPPETSFLRMAKSRGAKGLTGLTTLVYQGARSFEIWTGRPAPVDVMKRAVGLAR